MKNAIWRSALFLCSLAAIVWMGHQLSKTYQTQGEIRERINVYDKIEAQEPITYLIIGDSIGRGSGASNNQAKWNSLLENKMWWTQSISMKGDHLVQSGATAFEGLFRLQTQKETYSKNYDVIFIVFGENDRKYMTDHEFSILYEALIRQVKDLYPQGEIVTITESSLVDQDFILAIERISQHYNTLNINMAEAFLDSGKSEGALTKDGIHPNDEGYRIYADQIYNGLMETASSNKELSSITYPLHDQSADIMFEIYADYNKQKGFTREQDYFVGREKGDFIEFSFEGSLLGVKLLRSPDGGTVDVWIDGEHYTTMSTWWPFVRERYLYISSGLQPGYHSVRFEVTGETTNKLAAGESSVRLSSIIKRKTMDPGNSPKVKIE
ncbi:MAG: GDSL-type esterase/lipase family protein [Bacillus sp. (in: firmicutes)]